MSILSILPAAFFSAVKYRRMILPDIKVLGLFVLFTCVSEIFSITLNWKGINSSLAMGIHSTLEFFFIALYYSSQPRFRNLRVYYLMFGSITAVIMAYALFNQPYDFPSIPKAVQNVLIVLLSLYHAYRWFTYSGSKTYELLVILAFISYYLLTIVVFLYVNTMPSPLLWIIHDLFGIAANLLIFYALYDSLKSLNYGKL